MNTVPMPTEFDPTVPLRPLSNTAVPFLGIGWDTFSLIVVPLIVALLTLAVTAWRLYRGGYRYEVIGFDTLAPRLRRLAAARFDELADEEFRLLHPRRSGWWPALIETVVWTDGQTTATLVREDETGAVFGFTTVLEDGRVIETASAERVRPLLDALPQSGGRFHFELVSEATTEAVLATHRSRLATATAAQIPQPDLHVAAAAAAAAEYAYRCCAADNGETRHDGRIAELRGRLRIGDRLTPA